MPPVTPCKIRAIPKLCLASCECTARPPRMPARPAIAPYQANSVGAGALGGEPEVLTRALPGTRALPAVLVRDLALGDLFEGERQVVLRARLDKRRGELVEGALPELVVVVVDLSRALGGDDHQRVAGVDLVEELVDAGMDHRRAMVAARSSS